MTVSCMSDNMCRVLSMPPWEVAQVPQRTRGRYVNCKKKETLSLVTAGSLMDEFYSTYVTYSKDCLHQV